jgi:hypothetical protein
MQGGGHGMSYKEYQAMMLGLIATAREKVIVLGNKEARKDVLRIARTVEDLQEFWNGNGEFSALDYLDILERSVGDCLKGVRKVEK